jgi:hypothetical protein
MIEPDDRRDVGPSLWIVPLILVTIACMQIGTARFGTLTPWKGGGFGMFASVDRPENRYLALIGTAADGAHYRIAVPFADFTHPEPLTTRFAAKTISLPHTEGLRRIADAVLRSHVVLSTAGSRVMSTRLSQSMYQPLLATHDGVTSMLEVLGPQRQRKSFSGLKEVRASVLAARFDPLTERVTLYLLATGSANQAP